ncbi:MAG: hypothetical protein B7Z37_12335 [Verrucomicrobia bacterium 12-59-8]|nr:MAG: hypothetical protein B7Z37_12335 [Verrucomicrobia bacterium 12-59-8]
MKPNTTPCPSLTTVLTLPGRVDSALLAKHRRADEPLIVVKLVGVGNTAPYDFHDKGTRSYIFRFESLQEGHILRVPLHLWQAGKGRLAHDLMDQRRLPHAVVVTLDAPTAAKPTPLMNVTEMGATDTRTDTRNVVGPGAEPTVAPASGDMAASDDCCGNAPTKIPLGCRETCGGALGESALPAAGNAEQKLESQPREGGAACPQAAAVEAPDAISSTVSVAATSLQAEEPPLIGGRPLHEAAYDLVETPKRLKALAALLGVAEGALRAAIDHADSRLEVGNAGWVRRKV